MINSVSPAVPTQDERVMAALAHAGIILPLTGLLAPIVIWVTQKDKSKFVAFQALQALVYHLLMILGYFIGMGCYMLTFFSTFLSMPFSSSSSPSHSANPLFMAMFFIPFLVIGFIFLCAFFFIAYGIIGAVLAFQGKPFRYVLIGSRVEKFMQQAPNPLPNQ